MSLYDGAKVVGAVGAGLVPLPRVVNAHVGASAACLRRPNKQVDTLLLRGEVGGPWRLLVGDQVARSFVVAESAKGTITATSHNLSSTDGPFALSAVSAAALPAGLSMGSTYYTRAVDQHTLSLFLTEPDALAGRSAQATTTPGAGTLWIQGRPLLAAANGEIVNGLYGFPFTTGDGLKAFAAPERLTVVGSVVTDVLVYGWV